MRFVTEILGVPVTVKKLDLTEGSDVVAICVRGGKKQKIRLVDPPLSTPPPSGAEWIPAYKKWCQQK